MKHNFDYDMLGVCCISLRLTTAAKRSPLDMIVSDESQFWPIRSLLLRLVDIEVQNQNPRN